MSVAPARPRDWTGAAAEDYLRSLELFGMHFGLERMRALLAELGEPQRRFGSVHVVGTNGKSSTTRMLAAILAAEGLRVGAYLSPHLVSYTERVRIDGCDVAPDRWATSVQCTAAAGREVDRRLVGGGPVTQFEALTAAAFAVLADDGIDAAVVEAGLGGRHDATNVIASRVQVLTNVALEHTRWLGTTVAAIAREKVEVVQPGATLVVGAGLHPDALAVAEEVAAQRSARMLTAPADLGVAVAAPGAHQRRNFALAATAAEAYLGRPVGAGALAKGAAVELPGRLQTVAHEPQTVLDGAHNPEGVAALVQALESMAAGRRIVACVSVLQDKDADAMLRALLPLCAAIVVCTTGDQRALAPEDLAALAREAGGPDAHVVVEPAPLLAVGRARVLAGPAGLVIATGSLTLVGELVPLPEAAA